jgi:tetratricopeptide (TPR) repeat protein
LLNLFHIKNLIRKLSTTSETLMLNFTSKPVIALTARKLRLRTTLVLPFVLQIIAAVGLVGYLSFRNGQKAVNDLADQMIQDVGNRVVQHLDTYLHTPQLVNRLNADAVSLGELELENLPKVEQHLFARLMQFESISSVQIGNFRNDFRLVTRQGGLRLLQSKLISEDVLDRLSNQQQYKIRFLDRAIVKGRTEPIAVYEVLDAETEAIRELKLDTLQPFEQGLQHYCQGNFADAKACFEQVLAVNPLDKTAKLYLERVQELLLEGTPANWNGVWAFTQK